MSRRLAPPPTINDFFFQWDEDWDREIAPPASREACPPPAMSQDLPPPDEDWDQELEVVQQPPGHVFFKHGLPVFVFDHEQPPTETRKRRKRRKNKKRA